MKELLLEYCITVTITSICNFMIYSDSIKIKANSKNANKNREKVLLWIRSSNVQEFILTWL